MGSLKMCSDQVVDVEKLTFRGQAANKNSARKTKYTHSDIEGTEI